jgi:hypothetical protein
MLKDDLTVHSFSLKKIIENLDKIPEKTGKFGEPSNSLSKQDKKNLHEKIRKFNEYGQALRGDQALMETARTLSEINSMAKKYALSESNADFMQKETVQRDFKQADGITQNFQKLAKECVSKLMQLNALYEDLGHIYERYYEMENITESAPPAIPPMGAGGMNECDCDDPNHEHNQMGQEPDQSAGEFGEQM